MNASTPTTSCPSPSNRSQRWEPINPAAPVTRHFTRKSPKLFHQPKRESTQRYFPNAAVAATAGLSMTRRSAIPVVTTHLGAERHVDEPRLWAEIRSEEHTSEL